MREKAYFHLPGLFEFYELYRMFLPLYREHREYFYDWCEIGSVYGAPADCIWGGGRAGFGENDPEEVLELMQEYGISARLTFSNSLLRQEHLSDRKCNALCRLFERNREPQNGVIIYSELLLEYIKEQYPGLYFVSSTTKVLTDFTQLEEEIRRKDFRYVVPDFRLNKAFDKLNTLSQAEKDKVEFLCNECCWFGCRDRKACYETVSRNGTKKCFFSVNGSTAALLAAVSASVNKGGKILVARNCHKAVYHAVYLRELQPVYIYPHEDQRLGINGGISPERVERYLEENTDVQAFLLTSPTYDGVVSDIKTIAEVVHRHKIPLIVDEAHGAHLHYSKYFPVSAADLGADIVIQSFHKTLPSMTQTAVLHICSDMADVEKIKRFMGIYQTSSPSYILMASMDACMDKLRKDGQQMFREFTFNLEKARQRLSKCEKIKLIEGSMIESSGIYDFDRSKLLFSTVGTSVNGHLLHQILRDRYHIEMEMAAEKYVLGIAAVGDTEEGFERLCTAIEEIDAEIQQTDESEESQYHTSHARMTQLMTISQAVDAQQRRYSLKESVGKVSAEFAYLYPPGIPIIVPGEQITGQFVRNVRRYMEQGLEVQGLSDTSAETICVAARNEIGQEEYSPAKE